MVTLREGDSLSLHCNELAGSPTPSLRSVIVVLPRNLICNLIANAHYSWSKCDGDSLSEGGVYTAHNVRRDQAGCYRCEADNGYTASPVSAEVTVIVQCEYQLSVIPHNCPEYVTFSCT